MKKIKVSSSTLRDVARCSTLAMVHTAGWGTKSGGDTDKRLLAGHAAHIALEHWLRGAADDESMGWFRKEYIDFSNTYLVAGKDLYHHENLERILWEVLEKHPLQEMPFKVVATEREIEVPLVDDSLQGGIPVFLTDRADGLVENKEDGSLWPIEHKTTGEDITKPSWVNQWRMDPQIIGHIYCWRQEGYDVKGVLMNAIQFNRIPQLQYQNKAGEWKDLKCRSKDHLGMFTNDCWPSHVHQNLFWVQPSDAAYQAWLKEQKNNARQYRDLLLGHYGDDIPQEGLVNGHCGHCHLQEFCYRGREAYELLVKRETPSWITKSGLYEELS